MVAWVVPTTASVVAPFPKATLLATLALALVPMAMALLADASPESPSTME